MKKEKLPKKRKTVFVGLSGGVDSSVSAALLKQKGYKVTGVFIKGWYPDFLPCEWREERRDAMRVCALLDIPFITLDAEKEYKKNVTDYMISEYRKGKTPNPDIMCNKYIKFGSFLKFALANGADFIATGHYARVVKHNDRYKLYVGVDDSKDQSYFLWTLSEANLSHVLFPIGTLKKVEVRKLAKKFLLPTALKKDSQGICFLGKVDLKEFLNHYIPPKMGYVLDVKGKKIGIHEGVNFLTIGQRHGFTINNKTNNSRPFYVIAKDIKTNTIVVSDDYKDPSVAFGDKNILLKEVNWINGIPNKKENYFVRFRYRQALIKAKLELGTSGWEVSFSKCFTGMSAGQSLVVYTKKGECVGGGRIFKTF